MRIANYAMEILHWRFSLYSVLQRKELLAIIASLQNIYKLEKSDGLSRLEADYVKEWRQECDTERSA